jgi:hypothetical protein
MEDVHSVLPALQAMLAAAGFGDIQMHVDEDGQLVVEGEVADAQAEQMVIDMVMSSGVEDADFLMTWADADDGEEDWAEEAARAAAAAEEEFGGGDAYVVKKGDSYWKIAAAFYGKGNGKHYKLIQEANGGREVIHPGDVLIIPPSPA